MTYEEAIKELKSDKELYESDIVSAGDGTPEGDLILALDMAISALEKQIAKKVKSEKSTIDGFIDYSCPICQGYLIDKTSHCCYCGQALDWGKNG